jgi:hypothetical protein
MRLLWSNRFMNRGRCVPCAVKATMSVVSPTITVAVPRFRRLTR